MARKRQSLLKRTKRLAKKTLRKAKRARKAIRKTTKAVKRGLKKRRSARKKRLTEARRAERERRRSEERQEIQGSADISQATIIRASQDRGASQPGEPPKMRTGKGRDSIKAELRKRGQKMVSRVYVDKKIAPYMAMWEFRQDGQQRPFLKPGVENNKGIFGGVIGTELRRSSRSKPKQKAVVR